MRAGTRYAVSAAAVVLLLAVAVAASLWLSGEAIARNDQKWCDTLNLLTSQPVQQPADPARDQSREGQYKFYTDLSTLKRQFGC